MLSSPYGDFQPVTGAMALVDAARGAAVAMRDYVQPVIARAIADLLPSAPTDAIEHSEQLRADLELLEARP